MNNINGGVYHGWLIVHESRLGTHNDTRNVLSVCLSKCVSVFVWICIYMPGYVILNKHIHIYIIIDIFKWMMIYHGFVQIWAGMKRSVQSKSQIEREQHDELADREVWWSREWGSDSKQYWVYNDMRKSPYNIDLFRLVWRFKCLIKSVTSSTTPLLWTSSSNQASWNGGPDCVSPTTSSASCSNLSVWGG